MGGEKEKREKSKGKEKVKESELAKRCISPHPSAMLRVISSYAKEHQRMPFLPLTEPTNFVIQSQSKSKSLCSGVFRSSSDFLFGA